MSRFAPLAAAPAVLMLCSSLLLAPPAVAERHHDGMLLSDGIPDAALADNTTWERFSAVRSARLLDWMSDGSLLIATRFASAQQVHRVRQALGAREQLTFFGGDVLAAQAPPGEAAQFALLRQDGAGRALYLQGVARGAERLLAPADTQPGPAVFSHDGKHIAYSDRRRDGQHADLYLADTDHDGPGRLIAAGTAPDWRALGFTPDDRQLLTWRVDASAGDELALVEVASGRRTPIALQAPPAGTGATGAARRRGAPPPPPPPVHLAEPRLAGDGRGVYFLERNDTGTSLHYARADGSEQLALLPDLAADISHFDVSGDQRFLAASYDEAGISRLLLVDRQLHLTLQIPGLPTGTIAALRFDRAGQRLAINLGTATAPLDVYVYSLTDHRLERWTASEIGAQESGAGLVEPERIRYPGLTGNDGAARQLDALLYQPPAGERHGVLVLLPGETGIALHYDPFIQFVVTQLGLAVVQPAPDPGAPGALRDLGFLLAYLGLQPGIDRDRMLVAGTGAGARQALAALTLYGDRLRGAIAVDGLPDASQAGLIGRPVLLLRGVAAEPADVGAAEQALWRLRNAGGRVWYASVDQPDVPAAERRAAAERLSLAFIGSLLSSAR